MPRLAANLTLLFTEQAFLNRFDAAARCGFRGVEFLFPYDHPVEAVSAARSDAGVEVALFNLPPGDWDAGERGLAALPGREAEFLDGVEQALVYARALDVRTLHAMAGVMPDGADVAALEATYIANLRAAADRAARHGITITVEAINRRDMPGYFLCSAAKACEILDAAGRDNLRLQLDLYHLQVTAGDLSGHVTRCFDRLAHVQIAGHPGRHEPDRGEIRYPPVLDLLDQLGYAGWVGCEYRPASGTAEGLGWARSYGISPIN